MAFVIRIILIVVIVVLIVLIFRSKLKDWIRVLLIVLLVLIGVLANMAPIERWFSHASTPEEAFAQTVSSGRIIDIIHGDNSCLIYYSTGENSYSICFFEMENNEYRPIDLVDVKVVSAYREDLNFIRVLQLPDTEEYYLCGRLHSSIPALDLQDQDGTVFQTYEVYQVANDWAYDIFAYLPDYTGSYQLRANNTLIPLPIMTDQNLSIFNFAL